jgi:hypothetical protein
MFHRVVPILVAFFAAVCGLAQPGPVLAADIRIIQLDKFDDQHNGSIDVDSGIGSNLRQDGEILCNLLLEGPIEKGDLARLTAVIGAQREQQFSTPPRLCLHSPGGSYGEGLDIARYLMAESIGTAVPAGAECYSACAIIFMGGTYPWKGELNRFLHTRAILGFHAPYIPDSNNKNRIMVDEGEVGAAFSDGIKAMKFFMDLGVGNEVKRITPELMQEMIARGPSEFFFVDTVGKAIRFRIHLYGVDQPPQVDGYGLCNACVNMNYGAHESYGAGGDTDICKDVPEVRTQTFPKGTRYTSDVAPRGGECAIDVRRDNGKITAWTFRNDERAEFSDGLELAYWYLLSPSTKIETLTKPAKGAGETHGGSKPVDDAEVERLRRALFNFVVIEYLGHGRANHTDRPELFAPEVKYYNKGVIPREAVLADKESYYKRWPQRRYELIADSVQAAAASGDSLDITFRYEFQVSRGAETRRGRGVSRLGVQLIDGQFAIISEDGEVEK